MLLVKPVVLITGAASGIGHATALAFARAGYRVVITDINENNGPKVAKEIVSLGSEAIFVHDDHSKEIDNARVVDTTLRAFGRLDAAVNNAGVEGSPRFKNRATNGSQLSAHTQR